ncbi:aspartate kinase [Alkalicoccus urumqiensis]|uniref:Aspartokinase n=1 Tax=Alkalicoccus urumqiensis TaxID=1548213 RepID=A0A2P6MK19_ALKUR|nr:aspartate kinase [Alkalicoccus urumqiensis]PRO66629.1 aspartate kinase [Alkalicoccus urumqiensis]
MVKVVKFGGSSVADAAQFAKVASIVEADPERRFIVVSAPGKRFSEDIKTTDLLIALAEQVMEGGVNEDYALQQVVERYEAIVAELDLERTLLDDLKTQLESLISSYREDGPRLMDALMASGENENAKLMAAYLRKRGNTASYVSPEEAGMMVTGDPGNARILPESYDQLIRLREKEGLMVIPGFFGVSKNGHIVTFPRGGSDITGSIVAAGVEASLYENFTDVSSIYSVNPSLVDHPHEMDELTYREMRELAYAGFSVFHDEALQPVVAKKVPVCIKNTNDPEAPGTHIVSDREQRGLPVIGIASDEGFVTINLTKYLMNREVGFGMKLLQILSEEGISFEHTPSGIDNMSVILREEYLSDEKEARILTRIKSELDIEDVTVERDLAVVMVVGEGMASTVGVAAKATAALAGAGVNIKMINQGSSEVSMMFGVNASQADLAVKSLYEACFEKEPQS